MKDTRNRELRYAHHFFRGGGLNHFWLNCWSETKNRSPAIIGSAQDHRDHKQEDLHFIKKKSWCACGRMTGIVHYELLPQETTIAGEVYASQLQRISQGMNWKHSAIVNRKGIIFLQDCAQPHVTRPEAEALYPKLGTTISSAIFAKHVTYRLSSFTLLRKSYAQL